MVVYVARDRHHLVVRCMVTLPLAKIAWTSRANMLPKYVARRIKDQCARRDQRPRHHKDAEMGYSRNKTRSLDTGLMPN